MNIDDQPAATCESTLVLRSGGRRRDTKYSWALPAIHGFTLTRFELRIIAQHRLDEVCDIETWMAVADSLNSRDHQDHMVAVRKLEKVRRALGEVEFTEATSEVKETWDKRFAELKESILACQNYDREMHDHSV